MKANFQHTQAQSFLCKQTKHWALSLQTLVCTMRLALLTKVLEREFPKEAVHAVFDSAFMIYTQSI